MAESQLVPLPEPCSASRGEVVLRTLVSQVATLLSAAERVDVVFAVVEVAGWTVAGEPGVALKVEGVVAAGWWWRKPAAAAERREPVLLLTALDGCAGSGGEGQAS